jgi:hypothetical protein
MSALEMAMQRFPHQRLGQLIVNAMPPHMGTDPFYITDEAMARFLLAYIAEADRVAAV